MSVKLTIEIPLHLAVAVCNNDHDQAQLARYVVNAINRVPSRDERDSVDDCSETEATFTESGLSTPPAASDDGSNTMIDFDRTQTISPTGTMRDEAERTQTFFIDIEHYTSYGQRQALYTVPARDDITVGEVMELLHVITNVKPVEQRLLLNGKCLNSEQTFRTVRVVYHHGNGI